MSHSQWEKKKYKKAASEGKISKLYSKLVRNIMSEVKKSGGNRDADSVRAAITKARSYDMPNENIERAIARASEPSAALESITYEAYGPGGVGIVIEALTENRNKAAQEIKHILSKHGAVLGAIGSVVWNFTKIQDGNGFHWIPKSTLSLEDKEEEALALLIDELEQNNEVQDVYTNATN